VDDRVEIGLRDIYDTQQEQGRTLAGISTRLGEIAGRLDSGQRTMADHEDRLRVIEQFPKVPATEVADHESRIRALERFQLKAAGGIIALNGLAVFLEWLLFVHK
jgi:hypothetical protein